MANTTITPVVAALSLSIQKVALAIAGTLALAGAAGSMNLGATPLSGSAGFSGSASTLTAGTVTPSAGTASFASPGAILSLNIASGGAASLSAAGIAPVFASGSGPVLGAGSMSIGADAPLLAAGIASPPTGSAFLTGNLANAMVPNMTLQTASGVLQLVGGLSSPSASIIPVTGQWTVGAFAPRLNLTITLTVAATAPLALNSDSPILDQGFTPSSGLGMLTTFGILSPTLSPSIASLTLSGGAPSLAYGSPLIAPNSGAAQLVGTGINFTLSVPAAPAANLVLGGLQPQVLAKILASPSAGAVQAAGGAAGLISGSLLRPPLGDLQISGPNPVLLITLNGAAGRLDLSALAPRISVGNVLAPTAGSAVMAGSVPAFQPGIALNTLAGVMGLAAGAPTLLPGLTVPTGASSMASSPLTLGLSIKPTGQALITAGAAPTVNGRAIVSVPTGSVGLSAGTPVQTYSINSLTGHTGLSGIGASIGLGIIGRSGSIGATTDAPAVSLSGLVLSVSGSTSLAGALPVLGLGIAPRAHAGQLDSVLPVVNSLTTVFTVTGGLSIDSEGSAVRQPGVIPPLTGAMGLSSDQTQTLRSGYAAPPTATLSLSPSDPGVIRTVAGYCTPGSATLGFSGQPAVNALYEADLVHIVTLPGPYLYVVQLSG